LISELLELSIRLGRGWSNEKHDLIKQAECPHCQMRVSVRFKRAGKDPNRALGKYNIEKLWLEKGKVENTSYFKTGKWGVQSIEKAGKRNVDSWTEG